MMDTQTFISHIPFSSGSEVAAWHSCGLIAINKKADRVSHPNQNDALKGRVPMIRAAYNMDGEYFSWEILPEEDDLAEGFQKAKKRLRLYLINRLDSPTSGIVFAATNREVADLAKEAFRNKEVEKIYYAICIGRPFQQMGTFVDRLSKKSGRGFVRSAVASNGSPAITEYVVESTDANKAGFSLIKLMPKTGFTHQLRVQCAQRRFPILGDASYGNFSANKRIRAITKINRLFLHCHSTKLKINLGGDEIEFQAQAPIPSSFDAIMKFNYPIMQNFRIPPPRMGRQ